ncbi:TPA: oligosaccharide flippase family protein, partial [Streptococcus suis]
MKNKIAKNTLFLYILTFSNYFLGLMLFPYLSRVLSVEKFGLVGFSMSFVLIFQMIVEYGFSISGTAQIAKYQSD